MSEETIDYRKLAEALAEALEQRNLWIEGEEYRELVILRMRLSARVDSLAEELKAATARIAELETLVDELKPYRDGYDPDEVFPPEGEWVWLRDCDDNIEPVQYSHKTEWYWNYEGFWMPDNGDIRRWYPIGKLPEVTE